MLDIKRLRILREVALQGSLSAAAARLTFSSSAVSQHVAALERELGVNLVERSNTGVRLTHAGRLLIPHANAILARADDAERELRQLSNGGLGTLRIAAFSTAAAALMPDAILEFTATCPLIEIELVERSCDASFDQLRSGSLDLAVVVQPRDANGELGLHVNHLLDDYVDVILPTSHRLAGSASVSLRELEDDPWAEFGSRPAVDHLADVGLTPRVVFRSDHHRVIEGVVAAGRAVAFLPRLAQPPARRDVVVKPIAPERPARRIALAIRDREPQANGINGMAEILHRVAAARGDDG